MPLRTIDLGPLKNAISTLEDVLQQSKTVYMRDAAIQRYEYTYELAWKFMKRYLEQQYSSEEIDALSRKDLFRYAREQGLIRNVESWFEYHQARNETSHGYDQDIAERVYMAAQKFLPDVTQLLQELERRV